MPITTELLETATTHEPHEAFAHEVRRGLARRPKSLSSAWFYDDRGSRLFEEITQLPEYYLTRCEHEILTAQAGNLGQQLAGEPFRIVEIGAGDGHKTELLLRQFVQQGLEFEYVPIDICQRSIVDLIAKLRRTIKANFLVRGIVGEYHAALNLLRDQQPMRNLVLFLGSSIGNLDHVQAQQFLKGLRRSLTLGDLALIGFDLKKDPQILQQAYDDSAGVTRDFNLNLLDRINSELGGQFDRNLFQHHAAYNPVAGCMESYLVSRQRQIVRIAALNSSFLFEPWEAIKVECSYKYDAALIESLATSSGFCLGRQYQDRRGYFVDSLWEAGPTIPLPGAA